MTETQVSDAPKRARSPDFPYVGLSRCIELLETLNDAARGAEVRLPDIAQPWGMTPKSGSLARYVAALSQFGLVQTRGSGETRMVKVSEAGRRILKDERPGVREKLLSEAALNPARIKELYEGSERITGWGQNRPDDGIAISTLEFQLSFTHDAAKRFLAVYDETLPYITADPSSDKSTVDGDSEKELDSPKDIQKPEETVVQTATAAETQQTSTQTVVKRATNDIQFKSEGSGLISISATLDAKGLEDLEKKIAAFKLLLN